MELLGYLRILRRQWLLVLAAGLIGVSFASVITLLTSPMYTSRTSLFVSLQSSGSAAELQQGSNFAQAQTRSYVRAATTPVVLQPVIEELRLADTAEELAQRVDASAEVNTVVITISVDDRDPAAAASIAQAVADSFVRTIEDLERPAAATDSPVKVSILTPASIPTDAASPKPGLNALVGGVLGLALGIGLALLRSRMDTRIRSEGDLRTVTDIAILGTLPEDAEMDDSPVLSEVRIQHPRAEAFRQMRTNIQFANVNNDTQTILVTSSVPGEGKSTVSLNLAIAMAQGGLSVALVDADLRRPRIHSYLGLEGSAGLTTALIGRADYEELLQPLGTGELQVLTSGNVPPNPSEMLGSRPMKDLIRRLKERFDFVIIDAPPLLPVTDAAVLAAMVDGVVMVVSARNAGAHELERALGMLQWSDARILGVVLNHLPSRETEAYSYRYYDYGESASARRSVADGGRAARWRTKSPASTSRQTTDSSESIDQSFARLIDHPGLVEAPDAPSSPRSKLG